MNRAIAMAVIVALLQPVVALADQRTDQEKAVARARRAMYARGWRPTGQITKRQIADPTPHQLPDGTIVAGSTSQSPLDGSITQNADGTGTSINADGVSITWEGWEDGQSQTWAGIVTITGEEGDAVVHVQQLNFANPDDPTLMVDNQIYATPEPPDIQASDVQGRRECDGPCVGQAKKRARLDPDWSNYYKCAAGGCSVSGVLSILGLIFIPEYAFASVFFNGCTQSLLACSYFLWKWKTTHS